MHVIEEVTYRCGECYTDYDDEDEAEDCCSLYAESHMDMQELTAVAARMYQEFVALTELAGQQRLALALE